MENVQPFDPHHALLSDSALFDRALRIARVKAIGAHLIGLSRALDALDNNHHAAGHHGGTQTITLDEIAGSANRSGDFDAEFYPRREHLRQRWMRLARAMRHGESIPPIEVAKVGDRYFVIDGHHRVSVARALGGRFIEAVVTVWEIGCAEKIAC